MSEYNNFTVSVDITMNKYVKVEAASEEEALAKANEMVSKNPCNYAYDFSHYVRHEAICAEEVFDM
jgi:hypothetical protein